MKVTKEYCDKCGKEVKGRPWVQKLFPIICKSPRHYLCFRDNLVYSETTKEICEECYKEFLKWWNHEKSEYDCINKEKQDEPER